MNPCIPRSRLKGLLMIGKVASMYHTLHAAIISIMLSDISTTCLARESTTVPL